MCFCGGCSLASGKADEGVELKLCDVISVEADEGVELKLCDVISVEADGTDGEEGLRGEVGAVKQ